MDSVHLSGVESLSRIKRIARSRWPLLCLAAERRGFDFVFGDAIWDWDKMEGRERSVEEELKVWEIQPERRVGRSDMRVDEEDEYIDTEGRMSEILLSGRSGRVRARGGGSDISTITGISSTLSAYSPSPSVVVALSSWAFPPPDRPLCELVWLGNTAEEAGDVWEDELELPMLVELSVAAGSVKDFDLSRLCLWRNLDNFEPCGGLGDDGGGGALRDCLDIVVLGVDAVVVDRGCMVVVTDDVDKAGSSRVSCLS